MYLIKETESHVTIGLLLGLLLLGLLGGGSGGSSTRGSSSGSGGGTTSGHGGELASTLSNNLEKAVRIYGGNKSSCHTELMFLPASFSVSSWA